MSERIALRNVPTQRTPLGRGRFGVIRQRLGGLFLAIFFLAPWLTWNGQPALRLDGVQPSIQVIGNSFGPQDFYLLIGVALVVIFTLLAVTVWLGRVWCGYACPQTVWIALFVACERFIEGSPARSFAPGDATSSTRKPRNATTNLQRRRFWRRLLKHGAWLSIALCTALTLSGYCLPIRSLAEAFFTGQASVWTYAWSTFLTLAIYGNAGWLREQVCLHMCPYARLQSVVLDPQTRTVAYNAQRGEPRNGASHSVSHSAALSEALSDTDLSTGDCIACTRCVQVCPTGIDIRDGLQLACIGCAACIDACDAVMDKVQLPRGLIRYASHAELNGQPAAILRWRLAGWAGLAVLAFGVLSWAIATRPLTLVDVSKDRLLYRLTDAGRIENVYRLKITNKDRHAHVYSLNASGLPNLHWQGSQRITVAAQADIDIVAALSVAASDLTEPTARIIFTVQADSNAPAIDTPSRFTGPRP